MKIYGLLIICSFLFYFSISCKREVSLETNWNNNSSGSLKTVEVHGNYILGLLLTDSNYLLASTLITSPGKYYLWTDTVNGFGFSASGYISNIGTIDINMSSFGTVLKDSNTDFILHFDTSILPFSVIPLNASYIFDAQTQSCPTMQVFGSYIQKASLTVSDSVRIPIVVNRTGKYIIQTARVNNISFSDSGLFTRLGKDTLTLYASGIPSDTGIYNIPVSISGRTCDIEIPIIPKINMTMYWYFTAEGFTHNGYIPDSLFIDQSDSIIQFIDIQGKVLPDSTNTQYVMPFELGVGRIHHNITTGSYKPSAQPYNDYFAVFNQSHVTTSTTYTATNYLPGFSIQLLEIDRNSGLIRGTFSGPVYKTVNANPNFPRDNNNPIINITDGYFQGYLRKK